MQPSGQGHPKSEFDLSVLSASGAHVLVLTEAPLAAVQFTKQYLYNAGVRGGEEPMALEFKGQQAKEQAVEFAAATLDGRPRSEVRIVEEGELWGLGDALLTLASRLALERPDLVLLPLRGGRKLGHLLAAMLPDHPPFIEVEFSEAATLENDDYYLAHLRASIASANPGKPIFRLAVADIGKGGHGTVKMANLLLRLHDERYKKQHWKAILHVLHPPVADNRFSSAEVVTDRFVAIVQSYPTNTAILDDWAEMIGLDKAYREVQSTLSGGTTIRIPHAIEMTGPAAIVLVRWDSVRAITSSRGTHLLNKLLSEITTLAVGSSPQLIRAPDRDLWT
jgi:hypothetical protein